MTKPWDEMTPRERDVLIAQRLGYTIYHYDKDYRENCYYMLMDLNSSPVLAGKAGERKTEAEAWDDVPNLTTDYNNCRLIEDEIVRRKLHGEYLNCLALLLNEVHGGIISRDPWYIFRSTPEERCRAALEVLS